MDLTGDSDIEEAEPHDEDYSSYELDDSDAVLGKFSREVVAYETFRHQKKYCEEIVCFTPIGSQIC